MYVACKKNHAYMDAHVRTGWIVINEILKMNQDTQQIPQKLASWAFADELFSPNSRLLYDVCGRCSAQF